MINDAITYNISQTVTYLILTVTDVLLYIIINYNILYTYITSCPIKFVSIHKYIYLFILQCNMLTVTCRWVL